MGSTINTNYGRRHISADVHSGGADAFARLRVSNPFLLFESKPLFDKQPLQWDEAASGGASAATHSTTEAAITMTVSANGEKVIRQTKEHFNYQPGRSQLIMMTGLIGASVTNVRRCLGPFTDTDGLFFELQDAVFSVVIRKNSTDTKIAQTDWNLDKMNGTGASRITLDLEKAQLFTIDFEWQLILNPTVAGTFTYADLTNSFVQTALGATANTITGGTILDGGFAQSDAHIDVEVNTTLHLGATIANVPDSIVLSVRPLSINANIQASLAWRELQ